MDRVCLCATGVQCKTYLAATARTATTVTAATDPSDHSTPLSPLPLPLPLRRSLRHPLLVPVVAFPPVYGHPTQM